MSLLWMLSSLPVALMSVWPLAAAGEASRVSHTNLSPRDTFLQHMAKLPPAEAFQLPPCQLVNQTVSLEKEGCPRCHSVETTICSGYCITKDPVLKIPFSKVYQHVCTYHKVHYKTFELPDCPPGVDPAVTYPVALSCHCGRCAMATSDCTFESLHPNFCMNDIPFYN